MARLVAQALVHRISPHDVEMGASERSVDLVRHVSVVVALASERVGSLAA